MTSPLPAPPAHPAPGRPVQPEEDASPSPRGRRPDSHARGPLTKGFVAKLVLVGLVDALGLYGLLATGAQGSWALFGFLAVTLVVVNLVYFLPSGRLVPAKYLVPGLIFLLLYQVFVVVYTGYTSLTNWGDGHNSSKSDAIAAILSQNERRVEDSPTYALSVVQRGDELGFAVVEPDGDPQVGTAEQPLEPAPDATVEDGVITAVPGWDVLSFNELVQQQQAIVDLRVPFSDDPEDGSIRTTDGSVGYQYVSRFTYDEAADTITGPDGTVYTADESIGSFVDTAGNKLEPGWKVFVGFGNYTDVLTDQAIRGPFFSVLAWTFAFAILSVALSFGLGLFLAITFNSPRMRGRTVYRTLMILPYAFPAFLGTIVWAGMLNQTFGFVNQVLLGGAAVPWLVDPTLAKVSLILVNVWLGFPYMFLICTGALQSIPADVLEAASMDGAKPRRVFRAITLPLLLVSTAPLLIASFAFNFNNFNVIYLLTGGGPRDIAAGVNVGATDILITMVFKIAFEGLSRNYGLACAISILIFLIVASISAATFRKTKALEDLI